MENISIIYDEKIWDKIIFSFKNYDIYYLSGYVKGFNIHGDGIPLLIYYNKNSLRGMYVAMKRDISQFISFQHSLEKNQYYDLITPYGYGGFLLEGNINDENLNDLKNAYYSLLKEHNIITDFVRYNPILNNANSVRSIFNVIDIGSTISMDISSKQIIWENITSKNRNMIRKAQKMGVIIKHCRDWEMFDVFRQMYNDTMDRDAAVDYYYFKNDFYRSIYKDLKDNFEIFYAEFDNKVISCAIILYANNRMHYHLSGSDKDYRSLAPSNLLLYEVACWGCDHGFKIFHLGGGIGAGKDNLYKFKESFNRNSNNIFSIGKNIIDMDAYKYLINLRKEIEPTFDNKISYFPIYRG